MMSVYLQKLKSGFLAIAVAIAIFVGSGPAQALTLYDEDGTKIDLYNRVYFFFESTDMNRIEGLFSRFGFRASSQVSDVLRVFANAEFRYDASQRDPRQLNDRRNTFVGMDGVFGRVIMGNFDGVYYNAVSLPFDTYQNWGYVAMGGPHTASRANSVAYSSPDIVGLKLHGQVRHYSEDELGDEEFVMQAAATYQINGLALGLGAVIENEDAGFPETLIGFSANYQVLDPLSVRFMVEYEKDAGEEDFHVALGASYNYGYGFFHGSVGRTPNEDTYFALGATYRFSNPMQLFVEFASEDAVGTDDAITVGLRYDF